MVDNRSAGFFGIGGGFNFKSGDISGTASKSSDDRQSPGMDYFVQEGQQEEQSQDDSHFVDRSAQLKATLNSLAMMNVADIMNKNKLEKNEKDSKSDKNKKNINGKIPVWEDYQDENEDFLYVD